MDIENNQDGAEPSPASSGSGFFGWIGMPVSVRNVFRARGWSLARRGRDVTIECEEADEAELVFDWLEQLPAAIALADENLSRRKASEKDVDRYVALPLLERLRDNGDAMKIVPTFAIRAMMEAADEIERLRGQA